MIAAVFAHGYKFVYGNVAIVNCWLSIETIFAQNWDTQYIIGRIGRIGQSLIAQTDCMHCSESDLFMN